MDQDPPSSRVSADNESVGKALYRLRKRAGLTGQQLGRAVKMSQAKISRIENGVGAVDPADVRRVAHELNASEEEVARLIELAESGHNRMADWRPTELGAAGRQHEFAQLEATTQELRVFQPAVVVGLLQTSEYARAILAPFTEVADSRTADSTVDVSEAVSARVRRHEVLADATKQFRFVMAETVLTNRLCRPADMLAQLDRIREVARQENVTVSIVPENARWPIPPYHGFELADDRAVLVDTFNTTLRSRGRADIRLYRDVFDALERSGTTDIDPIIDRHFDIYLELSRRPRSRT
jgi:transcriptional regulator with XRE-family HTH domain